MAATVIRDLLLTVNLHAAVLYPPRPRQVAAQFTYLLDACIFSNHNRLRAHDMLHPQVVSPSLEYLNMLCRDVMKREVRCITAQTTVMEAAELMRDGGIGFLPVCDDDRTAIGTLTDRDIALRVVAEGETTDQPVEPFITPNIVACRPDDDLMAALDLMAEMQVSRIICLADTGRIEGIISLSDVAHIADGASAAATLRSVTIREARL